LAVAQNKNTKKGGGSNVSKKGRENESGSFGEWLDFLLPENDVPPLWPPDVFAVAAAFLRRTGSYVGFMDVSLGASVAHAPTARGAEEVGKEWRKRIVEVFEETSPKKKTSSNPIPQEIVQWWESLIKNKGKSFWDAAKDRGAQNAAWNLCTAADTAATGIGVYSTEGDAFLGVAQAVLYKNRNRSFCFAISPDKLAVLGKQHTPQRGCTIRSLSHHLALYTPSELRKLKRFGVVHIHRLVVHWTYLTSCCCRGRPKFRPLTSN
jgi:hypothetical protein